MSRRKIVSTLKALTEGLVGFMTYESRCKMSQVYNEYFLYYPINRILNVKGWDINAEKKVEKKYSNGDYKRVDFYLYNLSNKYKDNKGRKIGVAIEIKWIPNKSKYIPKIDKDIDKLKKLLGKRIIKNYCFIMFIGKHDSEKIIKLKNLEKKYYKLKILFEPTIYKTTYSKYGATIFEIKN